MTCPEADISCLIEASGVPLCTAQLQGQISKIVLFYQVFEGPLRGSRRAFLVVFAHFLGSAISDLASAFAGYRCLQPTRDDTLR
jgi:hypothetical protein